MQPIHIAREGTALGRFTAEDVAEGLRDGKFLPTDLAWSDPMPEWIPLSDFPGLPEVPPLDSPQQAPDLPPLPAGPPWEKREELGFIKALTETVTGFLVHPRTVYAGFQTEGGLRNPLLFLVLIGTVTGWVALTYQYVLTIVNPETLGEALKTFPPDKIWMLFAGMFVLMPVGVVISAFVSCGIFHVALLLLSKTPVRFESMFRIYCYAWGSASVLQVLPMCGGYLYPLFAIYLTVLGLRDVQKVNTPVAIFAVLLPILLCCGLMIFAVGLSAAGAAVSTVK
ncbi:MAG: DUF4339 domain-containing protein [Terrimicrobiaceae bacterium]